ncbi:hypothetical protein SUGI_0442550 [Cryptomeria japonica]|nr:hypothetical protein SUGI_0442550 [Cryptomeria japonica]
METHNFSPKSGANIESFLEIAESASGNDASEIIIQDVAQFELPPYEFYHRQGNFTENRILAPQNSSFRS